MLRLALCALLVASVAGVIGFGDLSANGAGMGQAVFFICVALFTAALLARSLRGRVPPP